MAEISAQMVKELREKSGAGMMDCKKALGESEGDFQKAMNLLRERGAAIANKRSSRVAKEGLVSAYVSPDKKTGTLVELNCESDFVARNDDFQKLSKDLAEHAATVSDIQALPESQFRGESVAEVVKGSIGKIGENIVLSRFARLKSDGSEGQPGFVVSYIHPPGKIGVLVELTGAGATGSSEAALAEIGRDVAMHIAATSPICVNRTQVPTGLLDNEREIYRKQALNEGKPEKIVEKVVDGRVQKYYNEVCLLDQPFAKNPDLKVEEYLKQGGAKAGGALAVSRFVRFRLGELADAEASQEAATV